MKIRRLGKHLCSFVVLLIVPGALAQGPDDVAPAQAATQAQTVTGAATNSNPSFIADDPIGDWLERHADRYGLFVDRTARSRQLVTRARSVQRGQQAPLPPALPADPSSAASSGASSGAQMAPQASKESDLPPSLGALGLVELPTGALGSEPFANIPILKPIPVPGASLIRSTGAICGNAPCSGDTALADGLMATLTSDYVVDRKSFTPPIEATSATNAAAQITAVMKDLQFGSKCSSFATSKGFGTWGKAVIKELVYGNANSLLQGTDDLRRACPNYDYLTIPEKSHVWVNVLASMSFLESSCDPNVVGKGPDGQAVGLLQLHAGQEHMAAPGCSRNDSRSAVTSLRCTIAIIETQIKRTSALFSRDTHFGVLRPQGDLVRTRTGALKRIVKARVVVGAIKELPFCQRK